LASLVLELGRPSRVAERADALLLSGRYVT
jgi:hypothetical protein